MAPYTDTHTDRDTYGLCVVLALQSNSVETGSHWVRIVFHLKCDSPQQIQVQHANAAKEMLTGNRNQQRE